MYLLYFFVWSYCIRMAEINSLISPFSHWIITNHNNTELLPSYYNISCTQQMQLVDFDWLLFSLSLYFLTNWLSISSFSSFSVFFFYSTRIRNIFLFNNMFFGFEIDDYFQLTKHTQYTHSQAHALIHTLNTRYKFCTAFSCGHLWFNFMCK